MKDDFINLLINSGIYDKIKVTEKDILDLINFFTGIYPIDIYCPDCGKVSIFKKESVPDPLFSSIRAIGKNIENSNQSIVPSGPNFLSEQFNTLKQVTGILHLNFICSRNMFHKITFLVLLKNDSLIKVGQYPTPIDITTKIPSKYSSLLESYFTEYKNSIELHTYNYHVGSYAYLRRIIEILTEDAHQNAIKDPGWNEDIYIQKHFDEKIKLLKNYLPKFFTLNVPMYGLISKGIHELSEEECRDMYPILKNAIDYTLDEIIEKKQNDTRKKETSIAISKLAAKHKKK
jgi:hypothetical protein